MLKKQTSPEIMVVSFFSFIVTFFIVIVFIIGIWHRLEKALNVSPVVEKAPEEAGISPKIESGQASCSDMRENVLVRDVEDVPIRAKKRLCLEGDMLEGGAQNVEEEPIVQAGPDPEVRMDVEADVSKAPSTAPPNKVFVTSVKSVEVTQPPLMPTECNLALGSADNIVAIATLAELQDTDDDNQTIHGVSLGRKNVRVSITRPLVLGAKLPFPVDDIDTVGGAVGTFVAWPKDLIVQSIAPPQNKKKKAAGRPSKKKKRLEGDDNDDNLTIDVKKLPFDYPGPLKCLWIWGTDALAEGKTILFMFTNNVFGVDRKQYQYKRDMYVMCTMGEVSGGILCMYMVYLHELLKRSKMLDMVAFVDPNQIGAVNCGNVEQS